METNLNQLNEKISELDKKYQIGLFIEQVTNLFKSIDISDENINHIVKNPFIVNDQVFAAVQNVDKEKITNCIQNYIKLKKQFKYDSYLKEGNNIRKTFLSERKKYFFNSSKNIKFGAKGKISNLEKLNVDFVEQKFIASWLDKLIKKSGTITIVYEDLDGQTKTITAQHKTINITKDYIEMPLIDRMFGENMFGSFLLHSFYDKDQQKYVYVPLKFIIDIKNDQDINYDTI